MITLETLQNLSDRMAGFKEGYDTCLKHIATIQEAEKKAEEAKNAASQA